MRETKFRAWSKQDNEMLPVLSIDFVNKYVELLPESEMEGGNVVHRSFDAIELMEFTGLRDKRNVEIYEGDVVNGETLGWVGNERKYVPAKGVVKYVGCGFVSDGIGEWKGAHLAINGLCEVVGNVHANPELL